MGKKYKNGLLRQPPSLLIGKHGPIIANTIARSLLLEAKTVEVQHLKDGSVDGYAKERNQRRSADGILFSQCSYIHPFDGGYCSNVSYTTSS